MDGQAGFLFVNKSATSFNLSHSESEEKVKIFRHVQRRPARQPSSDPASVSVPIGKFACWALQERGAGTRDSDSEVTQTKDGTKDLAVTNCQDPAIHRLTGDWFDPFDSLTKMTQYLPPAMERTAHYLVFQYILSIDLTESARTERLYNAFTRPAVMFSHLVMVVMENELADAERGKTLDLAFGTFALRYIRQEIMHVEDQCPWDLVCLASVFMFRAQVITCSEFSKFEVGSRFVLGHGSRGCSKGSPRWVDCHGSTQRRPSGICGVELHGAGWC